VAEKLQKNSIYDFNIPMIKKPEMIRLPADVKSKLRAIGAKGIAVIRFHDDFGPTLSYYTHDEDSTFIKVLKDNPSLTVELSILAKYAKEIKMESGSLVLIEKIHDVDKFGRRKTHLVVLEIRGKQRILPRKILSYIANKLQRSGLSKSTLVRALIEKTRSRKSRIICR